MAKPSPAEAQKGEFRYGPWGPNSQRHATLTGHQDSVGVLTFSPDGKTLASGSYDGTILLWDWETLKINLR